MFHHRGHWPSSISSEEYLAFFPKKHIGQDERLCIHDVYVSSHGDDKVTFHQKSWKMLGGKRLRRLV
jgi:hypothetical protein